MLQEYDSGWMHEGIGGLNLPALEVRCGEAQDVLRALGVSVGAGNRLSEAARVLGALNRKEIVPSGDSVDANTRTLEAIRAVWQTLVVLDAVKTRPQSAHLFPSGELRRFVKGPLVPTDTTIKDFENRRFENYAGALLVHGGLSVTRDEPDWRVQYFDEELGIAVKKLNSLADSAVADLMDEARGQIGGQGIRGMVLLDVSHLVDDVQPDLPAAEFGLVFTQRINAVRAAFHSLTPHPCVIGVISMGVIGRWMFDRGRPRLEWATPIQTTGFSDVEPTEKARRFFEDGYQPRLLTALERISRVASGQPN
jgi:hypothetical protein